MGKRDDTRHAAMLADRTSRRLESTLRDSLRWMLTNPDAYAASLLDSWDQAARDPLARPARLSELLSAEELNRIDFAGQNGSQIPGEDYVHVTRWARTRVVYTVDRTLGQELSRTDWSDTVIPSDVLAHLPHPNPMVLLPQPVVSPVSAEPARFMATLHDSTVFNERYEAFVVTGSANGRHCATDDPACTGLLLHFIGTVIDDRGRPVSAPMLDPNGTLRTIPATEGMHVAVALSDQTMSERRAHARATMSAPDFEDATAVNALTDQLIDIGLGLLVYLVTDEADTRHVRGRGGQRGRGSGDEATVVEVGYRIGPALARAAQQAVVRSEGTPTGRTVRAHIRRGHLRRVPYGPGRALRRIRWIPPVAVNWRAGETTQVHVASGHAAELS